VLYLDEPTTGLDPRSRTDVWAMVRELVTGGVTVLLTTQYLDEADQLADDIVVIDHGRVIATGTPDELKDRSGGQVLEVEPAGRAWLDRTVGVLASRTGAKPTADTESGLVRVPVPNASVLPVIIRDLDEAGVDLAQFTLRKASLDEVFLGLTGDRAPGQDGDHGPGRDHGQANGQDQVGYDGPADGHGHADPQHDDELRELERSPR
jgi:oleandomycin transport system ATP-binding protein